jgi:dethiobiotin synthetase
LFVTGTDTGVGKTLLTALLLQHLRDRGVQALAMKPFCSGGKGDVELLRKLQAPEVSTELINPFYFDKPVAPAVAARPPRRKIRLINAVGAIERVAERCDCLLVEGCGGVLVPLAEDFDVRDLISSLRCETIVVTRNKLGTLNHTRLTVEALQARKISVRGIALMEQKSREVSARTNRTMLERMLRGIELVRLPYLGPRATDLLVVKRSARRLKKSLAQLASFASFRPLFGTRLGNERFNILTGDRKGC